MDFVSKAKANTNSNQQENQTSRTNKLNSQTKKPTMSEIKKRVSKEFKETVKSVRTAQAFYIEEEVGKLAEDKKKDKEALKSIKQQWKKLSKDKIKVYKEKNVADKERFEHEKKVYLNGHDSIYDITPTTSGKRSKKTTVHPEFKLKKPASAYILFSNAERVKMKTETPVLKGPAVMKEIGKRWNALNANKASYKSQEKEAKDAYALAVAAFLKEKNLESIYIESTEAAPPAKRRKGKKPVNKDENINTANLP